MEVNGINLENYYPSRRSYNSVAYIHKKFFDSPKEKVPEIPVFDAAIDENISYAKQKRKAPKKKSKNNTAKHKTSKMEKKCEQTSVNNDAVLGQTIRFAKNIVPIVIPPNTNDAPVYYTIKTSRKSRPSNNKSKESPVTHQDTLTYKKQQEKKIIETFRKEKFEHHIENCSNESTSRSSRSIENIIISQSLNSTISEISDKRVRKTCRRDKRTYKTQVAASESLEALATELLHTSGEAKIKIHLMDDTAKDLFYESIRNPVLEAIRESVAEILHSRDIAESKTVQKYVQCHTQKLDNILDKLGSIEKRLDSADAKARSRVVRASALEEIGEDIVEENEDDFGDNVTILYSATEKQKVKCSSAARNSPLQKIDEVLNCSGPGEEISNVKATAPILSDRGNRIPTRYCWTDSTN